MATEAMRRKCAEATRVMAAHDDDHVEDDDDDHHVEDDDDAFFMNPYAEEAHGGNDDDDDDDDDDDGEIYFTGKRCSGRSLARHRWWYLSVHYKQRLLRGCPCAIKDAKPVKQNDKHHRRQAKSQFSYVL